jgi:hypothetical protein
MIFFHINRQSLCGSMVATVNSLKSKRNFLQWLRPSFAWWICRKHPLFRRWPFKEDNIRPRRSLWIRFPLNIRPLPIPLGYLHPQVMYRPFIIFIEASNNSLFVIFSNLHTFHWTWKTSKYVCTFQKNLFAINRYISSFSKKQNSENFFQPNLKNYL